MNPSVVLLLLLSVSACTFTVSLPSTTLTVSPPVTNVTSSVPPPPMLALSSTPALPKEVAVHILARFKPFDTETHVGPIEGVVIPDEFRLMTSFKAFEFKPEHVATMDCFFVNQDFVWTPMTTQVTNAQQHTGEPAFCARRDLPDNDTTFAVAQFQRMVFAAVWPAFERLVSRTRVFAAAGSSAKLLELARSRGWIDVPLATFRVTKLHHWRTTPVFTFVKEAYAVSVGNEQCLPDPTGLVDRKIEGGNYYAGVEGESPLFLCVSYATRGLEDLYPRSLENRHPRESFITKVWFRDSAFWRKSCATWFIDMAPTSLYWKDTHKAVVFSPYKGKKRYLCYNQGALTKGETESTKVTNTGSFAKRVWFDESFEKRNERLRVEYHDKNGWDFPDDPLDMDAIKKFQELS